MTSVDLTLSQKAILSTLTDLYRHTEDPIRGEDIAEEVNRNSGTVRNQMQSLKTLQLVEGVPGPKGGYKPTSNAYKALDIDKLKQPAVVPLSHNDEEITNANVESIDLSSVHHPKLCRAKVHIQGSIRDFHESDEITIGTTPLTKLQISGTIDGKDETNSILILQVDDMLAPTEETS